ncbi:MAG TPA: succinate dehydrogenase, hydrophobic membrane anchor protein [Stellaceae bacterium]
MADLPEVVGFFSYSREDDEAFQGTLSALRDGIQRELSAQLGRSKATFRLWQDQAAIAPGQLWESEIKTAVEQAVFFIPIVTPRAVNSHHCKFEFAAFLARERALGRTDLVFPLLYIGVPELESEAQWRKDSVLSIIGTRQYVDWRQFRHRDVREPAVREEIERFCDKIVEALRKPWVSPEERRKQEEIKAQQRADEKRRRQEAEAARRAEEERQQSKAARRVEEEKRQADAARQAEEEKRQAEAARLAEEEKRRAEAARLVERQRAEVAQLTVEKLEAAQQPLRDQDGTKTKRAWLPQRITAVALVPLALWFVTTIIRLAGADLQSFRAWVGGPLPAILLVLLLIATFWHASLGLQVTIEDYVHTEHAKFGLLIVMRLGCIGLAAAGIFAVLSMAVGRTS